MTLKDGVAEEKRIWVHSNLKLLTTCPSQRLNKKTSLRSYVDDNDDDDELNNSWILTTVKSPTELLNSNEKKRTIFFAVQLFPLSPVCPDWEVRERKRRTVGHKNTHTQTHMWML